MMDPIVDRPMVGLPVAGEEILPAGQIAVIGVPVGVMGADPPLGLFRVDLMAEGGDDDFDDLVLDLFTSTAEPL